MHGWKHKAMLVCVAREHRLRGSKEAVNYCHLAIISLAGCIKTLDARAFYPVSSHGACSA